MDIIDVIREQEANDAFLLGEEFGNMEQSVIRQFQDEAEQAYARLPQPEASQVAQVAMLAEIALQLAKLNTSLDAIGNLLLHRGDKAEPENDEMGTHPPDCSCYWCSQEEAL